MLLTTLVMHAVTIAMELQSSAQSRADQNRSAEEKLPGATRQARSDRSREGKGEGPTGARSGGVEQLFSGPE